MRCTTTRAVATTWRLAASSTHLYPGARLHCLDAPGARRLRAGDAVVLEFADGATAWASLRTVEPHVATLAVGAHRTRRGTTIAARRWRLVPGPSAGTLRIQARLPGG